MNGTRAAQILRENSRLKSTNRGLMLAVLVLAASLIVTLAIASPATLAWLFTLACTLVLAGAAVSGVLAGCRDRRRHQL